MSTHYIQMLVSYETLARAKDRYAFMHRDENGRQWRIHMVGESWICGSDAFLFVGGKYAGPYSIPKEFWA